MAFVNSKISSQIKDYWERLTIKKTVIIMILITVALHGSQWLIAHHIWHDIYESFENAGAKVGFFEEEKTARYKRKQEAIIKQKKEEEIAKANAEIEIAKANILDILNHYIDYRDNIYHKYFSADGSNLIKEGANKIKEEYQLIQHPLVQLLEECEEAIERDITAHISFAKHNREKLKDIKLQIGKYALKGDKGLTESEMQDLDELFSQVNSMKKIDYVTDRECLIFARFKSGIHKIRGAPCSFIIDQIWNELRKDQHFIKEIVPLRLKIRMQEYRHVIWKLHFMDEL